MIARIILAALAIIVTVPVSAETFRVIDGDTIEAMGHRWRLTGYDTPETFFARCDAERELGKRATEHLTTLMAGKPWRIVDGNRTDRYGRKLGRLVIDGRDASAIMIEAGLARAYDGRGPRAGWC